MRLRHLLVRGKLWGIKPEEIKNKALKQIMLPFCSVIFAHCSSFFVNDLNSAFPVFFYKSLNFQTRSV